MLRTSTLVLAGALALIVGCAKKPAVRDVAEEPLTAAKVRSNVRVSEDLVQKCNMHFGNVEQAPKFDFDQSALLPEDIMILEQVARCVTTGPLRGRRLALVGRADPRGETEYNLVLGEYRAGAVHDVLARLGVAPDTMSQTSRGELDADGNDEDGWRKDRRVDVMLQD